jgi:hypothetical protein
MCDQDLAIVDNRDQKDSLHQRWERKDAWANYPMHRDLALYSTKNSGDKKYEKGSMGGHRSAGVPMKGTLLTIGHPMSP